MTSYLFSGYPLSRGYRDQLEAKVRRPLEPVQLLELRQGGALRMLRALRRLKGEDLFVAYEEPSSKAVLPVLRIAAAVTGVRNHFLVDEKLHITPMRRAEAAGSAFGLIGASASGLATCGISMLRAKRLLATPRRPLKALGRRVLYLNANLWFGVKAGGSVGHISGVANGFAREGCEVTFFSAGGRLMVGEDIPYIELEAPRSFGIPWEANYYAFDSQVVRQVEPIARDLGPSFIYQRMSLANASGVRLSRHLGVPLVLEYNGSEVWIARHWGKPLRLETAASLTEAVCLKHAHLIVTVSNALRDDLLARGVEDSRIVVYPNCIDPEMFDPARFSDEECVTLRKRYRLESDATVVTFIGSFGQWHGVPVLAEVIRRMIEHESDWLDQHKVRFLLIGDGIKMPEVRRILGSHAEGPYVRLTGLVPQSTAPAHLAASDVLSSPHVPNTDGSRFFGSPTKLFEYMAIGKAIVASNLDQIGEVLKNSLPANQLSKNSTRVDGALAILSEPGNVEDHANGIRFLVNYPKLRIQLGVNARKEALERYTWGSHVRHILGRLEGDL